MDEYLLSIDAFTSAANVMFVHNFEEFTCGVKARVGGSLPSPAPFPSSRLEYQLRTSVVNVRTVRKGWLDEAKRVLFMICLLSLFSEQIQMKRAHR